MADIGITALTVSDTTPVPGQPMSLTWTMLNFEATAYNDVFTHYYVSRDNVLDLADHVFQGDFLSFDFAGGQTRSYTQGFTFPSHYTTAGTYYIFVEAEVFGDTYPSDNTRWAAVTVSSGGGGGDTTPPTVSIVANSSYIAGTVLSGFDLFNASDNTGIDFFKIYDAIPENGAVWRYDSAIISPGTGSLPYEYANRGLLTYTVGTGTNQFLIEATDFSGNFSAESQGLWTINGTAQSQNPDLTASIRSMSDTTLDPGQSVTVNYTINNIGAGATGGPSQVGVYISTDAFLGNGDDQWLGSEQIGTLAGNAPLNDSVTVALPTWVGAGQTYQIYVRADDFAQINNEISEFNNNSFPTLVTINGPSNAATVSISSAGTVNEGAQLVFGLTRTGSLSQALDVTYFISGGSAVQGSDYFQPTGTAHFNAFSNIASISIDTRADGVVESLIDETVSLTLNQPANMTLEMPRPPASSTTSIRVHPCFPPCQSQVQAQSQKAAYFLSN